MKTSRAAASRAALVAAPRSADRTIGCGTSVVIRLSPPTQRSLRLAPGPTALRDKATPALQVPRMTAWLQRGAPPFWGARTFWGARAHRQARPYREGGLCDDRGRGSGPAEPRAGRSDGRAGD